ncbi:MAG: 4-(cytidine 5'-diphospho)-2-C-methyl-D-erythritol kinase [Alphaproteobacteria bacterium]
MSDLSHIFNYLAPAKVNLCLQIGRKRADGYHELASIVGFTEFGDSLTIKLSETDQLVLRGQFSAHIDSKTSENLVMKAIHILRDHNHNIPPLEITIDKQIPVGGGLGGGSSDAATTFLALNEIFNLNISKTNLSDMALKIGADIPVCLNRHFVIMRGIGDKITTLSDSGLSDSGLSNYIVLANPNSIVSTRNVFEEFDKSTLQKNSEWLMESQDLTQLLTGGNNLQESALKIYPEIGLLLNTMKTLCPRDRKTGLFGPQMSGSGASCFTLFKDKKAADMLCRKIQQAGYWSVSTKFMSNF